MQTGLLHGRSAFAEALTATLTTAAEQGGRAMYWLDHDFLDWPLSEPGFLDQLSRWALPHRRLHLLAADYEPLRRRHPRFVQWRRQYDHVVQARQFNPDELPAAGPVSLMLVPGVACLRLLDRGLWRAALSADKADEIGAREWFDAIEQRAVESFAASTLGL